MVERKKMNILIVDDVKTNAEILNILLASFGNCDLAFNGNEALEKYRAALAENRHYDLICLDIMMPEVDGHEVLAEIRSIEDSRLSENQRAKVFIVSAAPGKARSG